MFIACMGSYVKPLVLRCGLYFKKMAFSRSAPALIPCYHHGHLIRRFASKVHVDLDKLIESKFGSEEIKPRHQPGIVKNRSARPSSKIVKALLKSIGDYPVKTLMNESLKLSQYIASRHPPIEKNKYMEKLSEIAAEVDSQFDMPDISTLSEEQLENYKKKRENKINKVLKQRTYAWKPITYGRYEGLVYMVGRSSLEYAALLRIMREIAHRNPNFKPRSYFDFGSGLGTGMWAASDLWRDSIFEYVNIDSSRDMNDLSELVLQEGNENSQPFLRNVFYRQFLPATETSYDLVVAAYTLFELPSSKHRKETILNLWRKCDGYFILVEEGTRQGFQLISEARDYILGLAEEELEGHVFAPCPHDLECPRLRDKKYNVPCNFEVAFEHFPFSGSRGTARCSYVVLRKGKREDTDDIHWPRIVRPTLVRSRHTICRLCTSSGKLQEVIFTMPNHGKWTYRCARSSRWGDRLPVIIKDNPDDEGQ